MIDPRKVGLAQNADFHLPIRPGANVAMFHSMAAVICEEGLEDRAFIEARTQASRAQQRFKTGSPGWLKADDILNYRPPKL